MAGDRKAPDLFELYTSTQRRLVSLVSGLDEAALATPVPTCPGWAVRDVLAHLTATTDDALAGRLTGPPSEEHTAAQVARFAGHDVPDLLAMWDDLGPRFARLLADLTIWPGVIDVASHEQDIRLALGQPGARDSDVVWHCAGVMLRWLKSPVPLRVVVEDAEFRAGPPEGAELALRTSRFEAFRWRVGRRSRAQLAAMAWSGDPSPVLDHLVVFGPSRRDIDE